jgi:hypothetical protein
VQHSPQFPELDSAPEDKDGDQNLNNDTYPEMRAVHPPAHPVVMVPTAHRAFALAISRMFLRFVIFHNVILLNNIY